MQPVLRSHIYQARLQFLGSGRYGEVYKTGYQFRFDPTELAYKEYNSPAAGSMAALNAVVFRDVLPIDQNGRAVLDTYFAWPLEIVVDDATGDICGFVMALAGDDFTWQEGNVGGELRTLDWLAAPDSTCQLAGVDQYMSAVTQTERLYLMKELTRAVDWLHKRGWVFGDFSFANAAFAMDPPRLKIFDCDDAADLKDPSRKPQPHTLNWFPPECTGSQPQKQQDFRTDVYKLGLAIIRCLKPELGATTTLDVTRLTGILDSDGIDLLTRALSSDRSERPLAEDLFTYLEKLTGTLMIPPVISHAELVTPLVMRGGNAEIIWQIAGAQNVRVFVAGNQRELVRAGTLDDYPDGCSFPVMQPGQVTLEADNRYGPARAEIGNVTPFEIPQLDLQLDRLPQPDIPPAPDYVDKPFPPRPADSPAAPDIPAITKLDFAERLRAFAPGGTIMSPGAHINEVLSGSRSLMDSIQAETERFSARLRRKNMRNDHG